MIFTKFFFFKMCELYKVLTIKTCYDSIHTLPININHLNICNTFNLNLYDSCDRYKFFSLQFSDMFVLPHRQRRRRHTSSLFCCLIFVDAKCLKIAHNFLQYARMQPKYFFWLTHACCCESIWFVYLNKTPRRT